MGSTIHRVRATLSQKRSTVLSLLCGSSKCWTAEDPSEILAPQQCKPGGAATVYYRCNPFNRGSDNPLLHHHQHIISTTPLCVRILSRPFFIEVSTILDVSFVYLTKTSSPSHSTNKSSVLHCQPL
ncbi:hypothetical protein BCV70DRAFT_71588 [Testicularia cyperi]|uniref:Uncharacterized protein n=1 Tax=Testicularia cyperi TaxID=1882483 RepID=A0A317XSP0_9BASI|nr:hypothetical protein BCV70DRAFT_71588 [Testicularia cyperi]